jgi:hypothetical protein
LVSYFQFAKQNLLSNFICALYAAKFMGVILLKNYALFMALECSLVPVSDLTRRIGGAA